MDKITEQDLANRGVKGLPDVPGLTTEEMQRKLEEIAREILIPKVNELVEGLNNANSNLNVYIDYAQNFTIAPNVQTGSYSYYTLDSLPTKDGYNFMYFIFRMGNSNGIPLAYQSTSRDIWIYGRATGNAAIHCTPVFIKK